MSNEEICVRVNQEIFGEGDLASAEELISPSFVDHEAPPGTPTGPKSVAQIVGMLHGAFDDIRYEVEDVFGHGDKVALRLTMSGIHTGNLFGREATGKRFSVGQIHIFRVEDAQVAEHWANRDDAGMMRQLGLAG